MFRYVTVLKWNVFFCLGILELRENNQVYDPQGLCAREIFDQVTKGVRGIPWHGEAMKDVVSCDKLRVGAHSR